MAKLQKRKKRPYIYKYILFITVIWFLGNSLFHFLIGIFVKTEFVTTGIIDKKYTAEAYVIRDEIVITSPATGNISFNITSGDRIAKGKEVFKVKFFEGTALEKNEILSSYASLAGVVSFHTDGLENVFKPGNLQEYDFTKIKELNINTAKKNQNDMVQKGQRVCKIVNNLQDIQFYVEVPLHLFASPLQKKQVLNLFIPELQKEFSAQIVDLKGIGDTAQLLLELDKFPNELINKRKQVFEIILEKNEGILIPNRALVNKDTEQLGVYEIRKGFVFFQPIKILKETADKVIIEGLDPLSEIVLTPSLVKEGQHLY